MFRAIKSYQINLRSLKKDVYRGLKIGIHSAWIGNKPYPKSLQAVEFPVPKDLNSAADAGRNAAGERHEAYKNQRDTFFHKPASRPKDWKYVR